MNAGSSRLSLLRLLRSRQSEHQFKIGSSNKSRGRGGGDLVLPHVGNELRHLRPALLCLLEKRARRIPTVLSHSSAHLHFHATAHCEPSSKTFAIYRPFLALNFSQSLCALELATVMSGRRRGSSRMLIAGLIPVKIYLVKKANSSYSKQTIAAIVHGSRLPDYKRGAVNIHLLGVMDCTDPWIRSKE